MIYDFDRVLKGDTDFRKKYDREGHRKPSDVFPMWIADMDFPSPPSVIEALLSQSRRGTFGYSEPNQAYRETLKEWFERRFDWKVADDWLVTSPGVTTSIHIAIRAFTMPGDRVIVQHPVYPPFTDAVTLTKRRLVVNKLVYTDNSYSIDFEDFEQKISVYRPKIFILCNPHNPVGRVWRQDELTRIGDICLNYGVIVISDEVHQDFIYPGFQHQIFTKLKPEYHNITITCTAPSKTFNLSGLQLANIFIPNPRLRKLFCQEYAAAGLSQPSLMGLIACKAAYDDGEEWLTKLLTYLSQTVGYVKGFLKQNIPRITLVPPEATYLLWLNCRQLGLSDEELNTVILHKAKLWLNDGSGFGDGGNGFQRMNIACPRATLEQALIRLQEATAHLLTAKPKRTDLEF